MKFFFRGVAYVYFKKSPIFTLKLHDLAISAAEAGENFLGRSDFQIFFSKKTNNVVSQRSKIQRGGQKALLEGVGS